jgi:hypothetical protein
MHPSFDDIAALILGRLEETRAEAVRAAIASSETATGIHRRLERAIATVQSDARDPVPASAIQAAIDLGSLLERHRRPSLAAQLEQALCEALGGAAAWLRARLVFDSRLQGSLAGLRGGTGFALAYAADGVDIDLECLPLPDGNFELIGQLSEPSTGTGFARLSVASTTSDNASPTNTTAETIDIDGDRMFRLRIPAGTYDLRFEPRDASARPLVVHALEVP